MNRFFIAVTAALMLAGTALAQERIKVEVGPLGAPAEHNRMFLSGEPGGKMMIAQSWEGLPEGKIAFLSADFAGMGEPVKDAPYTATATTESTQTLADGTHIVNKTSEFIARDGQGRTRHEQTFAKIGGLNMDPKKVILISDPAAHTDYIVNPDEQRTRIVKRDGVNVFIEGGDKSKQEIATKMKLRQAREERIKIEGQESKRVNHEDLGTQVIEGVTAQGRRETVTIAAGEIGNDRPIEIVSENWYSQDLHTVVLRKHTDPRFGETVFRLTEIKRGEPDPSLFQVPAGFKTSTTTEPTIRELPRRELPKD